MCEQLNDKTPIEGNQFSQACRLDRPQEMVDTCKNETRKGKSIWPVWNQEPNPVRQAAACLAQRPPKTEIAGEHVNWIIE